MMITTYSKPTKGDRRNFNWGARFDLTGGYLGITQTEDGVVSRVLLSPRQVKALLNFVEGKENERAR